MDGDNLFDILEEDIFSVLEAWENATNSHNNNNNNNNNNNSESGLLQGSNEEIISFEFQKSSSADQATEVEFGSPKCKRRKVAEGGGDDSQAEELGQQRMSHIAVERNRRKQMNENLSVLRALMPCFYVKRGDQASIIGGVVNYITELQQLLQALEAKKQRKSYTEILSPKPVSSPRPIISPRMPPLSPRLSLPVSPRTPQPSSPYKPYQPAGYLNSPPLHSPTQPSPPCDSSNSSTNDAVNELAASSKSAVAEVEVKFSGPNLVLKTVSRRVPGQAVRIVSALQELDLEILHVKITTVDERVLKSFTIKLELNASLVLKSWLSKFTTRSANAQTLWSLVNDEVAKRGVSVFN
ncbi:hypothetical protein CASFOL_006945 [Castilleja foliolosa]|uniref:BHLH domain-containing protein n=1 Tax=Castilleja foliolosa TaxID=1961234 RepID=A0ABD3E9V1_9LAMI